MGRHRRAASRDTPLSSRLWDKAHWLLWEAGKGLAILLLALAGGHGVWGARGELGGAWRVCCWGDAWSGGRAWSKVGTLNPWGLWCSQERDVWSMGGGWNIQGEKLGVWREGCLVQRGKESRERGCLVLGGRMQSKGEISIQGESCSLQGTDA